MKILLINAIRSEREVEIRYPNLGLCYLSAMIKKEFPGVITKYIDNDVEREILSFNPDYIMLSSISQNWNIAKEYVKIAKKYNKKVFVGGTHISMLPETITEGIDHVIVGEGEMAIIDLLNYYEKGIGDKPNRIIKYPMVNDIDILPLPDLSIIKVQKHFYMFTSRGCPYSCVFCSSSRFWAKVRFHSAERVVEEIKQLYNIYGVTLISFYDDLFIVDMDRLKKIITLLEREKLLGRIKFSCNARANLINENNAKVMKDMGIISVGMGIESLNEKSLKYLKPQSVTVADNKRAVDILRKYGISPSGSLVIGCPDETYEDIMVTYKELKKLKLTIFDMYLLTPLPGTPVWEEALKKELVRNDNNFDWAQLDIDYSKNINPIIVSNKLTKEQLIKWFWKFQRLRYRFVIKALLTHPYKRDFPKMAFNKIREFIKERLRK